jgi:hypothetical protein
VLLSIALAALLIEGSQRCRITMLKEIAYCAGQSLTCQHQRLLAQ